MFDKPRHHPPNLEDRDKCKGRSYGYMNFMMQSPSCKTDRLMLLKASEMVIKSMIGCHLYSEEIYSVGFVLTNLDIRHVQF